MPNIIQHYGTWFKKHCTRTGATRASTLSLNGFRATPHTYITSVHGSPIQRAKELAEKMVCSGEFDCNAVHFVLLDSKNMDNTTGYRIFRKLIQ